MLSISLGAPISTMLWPGTNSSNKLLRLSCQFLPRRLDVLRAGFASCVLHLDKYNHEFGRR